MQVLRSMLVGALMVAIPLTSVAQAVAPPAADGALRIPEVTVPFSPLASEAARRNFVEFAVAFDNLNKARRPGESIEIRRKRLDDLLVKPGVARLRAAFPVEIKSEVIGGVRTDIITPRQGVSPRNRRRVLLNLHGGGFLVGGGYGGQMESIPVASLGRITVVSIDYRMAPEHRFPAASEDVAAVYRELLKRYPARNIGLYGCSSGGLLAGQSVAWFESHALPRPGAVGILSAGLRLGDLGDSDYFGSLFGGTGLAPPTKPLSPTTSLYHRGADFADPLVSPLRSQALLRRFPPTLVISGTRDTQLSHAVYTHAALVKAGVDANLHVWEGVAHCSYAQPVVDPAVPENRDVWSVIVRFFDAKLEAR